MREANGSAQSKDPYTAPNLDLSPEKRLRI